MTDRFFKSSIKSNFSGIRKIPKVSFRRDQIWFRRKETFGIFRIPEKFDFIFQNCLMKKYEFSTRSTSAVPNFDFILNPSYLKFSKKSKGKLQMNEIKVV